MASKTTTPKARGRGRPESQDRNRSAWRATEAILYRLGDPEGNNDAGLARRVHVRLFESSVPVPALEALADAFNSES